MSHSPKKKKLLRISLYVLGTVLLAALIYVAYVLLAYHRIGDQVLTPQTVEGTEALESSAPLTGVTYRIVSANVGFGAYSADYSFFMDGGKESLARSEEAVHDNLEGSAGLIAALAPDFALVQEVDIDGTRSYHVDERIDMTQAFAGRSAVTVFAQNYDSPFLFYPFNAPHGANASGILTFSRFPVTSARRVSLPVETSLMKLVDLDRCYSVSRIAMGENKELVIYNLHLSAYTSDGTIATEQLEMITADMAAEYAKGNWCIAGGDFNKDLIGDGGECFGVKAAEDNTWAQAIPEGLIPEELTLVVPYDAEANVASCRTASAPYVPGEAFCITVDGFLVSANVEVTEAHVVDSGYAYSDHNPVWMDFILK